MEPASEPPELPSIFVAHARVRVALPGTGELDRLLRRAYDMARSRWPGVVLPAGRFIRHLAERLPGQAEGVAVEAALEPLPLDELYLACACADRMPEAIEAFEQQYMRKIPGLLAFLPQDVIEDACQKVRERFLIGPPGGVPQISQFSGRGSLMSLLLIAASRAAVVRGGARKMVPVDSVSSLMERLPAIGQDLELEIIRGDAREAFESCLRDAVSALSEEEQVLLRFHYAGRLSTVALAKLTGVSQPTVSRRLQSVRNKVFEETKRLIKERLDINSKEFQSYLTSLGSRLDVNISQIFGEAPPATPGSHPSR